MGDQDHNQVIKELEARIKDAPPRPNAKIVDILQSAIRQQNTFVIPVRLHCEIVLATLGLKESRDAAFRDGNGPLAELCEVW